MKCEKNNIIVFLLNGLDFSIPMNYENRTAHTILIGSYITDNRCYLWLYSIIDKKKKNFSLRTPSTLHVMFQFLRG